MGLFHVIRDSTKPERGQKSFKIENQSVKLNTIQFQLVGGDEDHEHGGVIESSSNYMFLLRIEPRSEWVAIHRRHWGLTDLNKESQYYHGPLDPHSHAEARGAVTSGREYRRPFTPDYYCISKIIEAFGVNPRTINFDDVVNKSPSELENLAKHRWYNLYVES